MTPAIAVDSRLRTLGWTAALAAEAATVSGEGFRAARIASDFGSDLRVLTAAGAERAQLSPELYRDSRRGGRAVVGDWVLLAGATGTAAIVHRLARRSALSRRRAGGDQVLAANVDVAFVVTDVEDLDVRRIERYVACARAAPALPVVVLTKIDLEADVREQVATLHRAAAGAPVHSISSSDGRGMAALGQYLTPGRTVCLLGSSGVGKSTLLNRLLGYERLRTQATGRHGRGRHTTTHRELVLLPSGGLLIDNPGLHDVGLPQAGRGAEDAFADLVALAEDCRYRDCSHEAEPECAVRAAAETGEIAAGRLVSFQALARERRSRARPGALAPRLGPRRPSRDRADWSR